MDTIMLRAVGLDADRLAEYAWRARERHRHGVELDLAITGAACSAAVHISTEDSRSPSELALQWLAAQEAARLGARGSRPTRAVERECATALGCAATDILAQWRPDMPPAPRELYHAARRHDLFRQAAMVGAEVVAPGGLVRIEAIREEESAVWRISLNAETSRHVARGYFGSGVLSPRSVRVEAYPLFDADERFWGIEARAYITRKAGVEIFGAEWHREIVQDLTPDWRTVPGTRWIASDVGRLEEVHVPWPACGKTYIRQGDVVLQRRLDAPDPATIETDERRYEVLQHAHAEGVRWWRVRHRVHTTGARKWIEVPESGTILHHPDHPSVRLPGGWWCYHRGSSAVAPGIHD